MTIYLVGGAVRDDLLGIPFVERDWVVVGSDREHMLEQGFVPADESFPVFRHPQTGEEYALARREAKQGEGYRGFEVYAGPDVTLEEDLRRRDLTINAMARAENGELVDPYGGRDDLDNGLLRHVSEAFVEDPLRVLRIARFAAKLGRHGFRVSHGTHRLMREMVERGDMRHLTAERIWRELSQAMAYEQPWRFFEVLQACGALADVLLPLSQLMGESKAHDDVSDSLPIAALKRVVPRVPDAPARLAAALWSCVKDAHQAKQLAQVLRADRESARLLTQMGTSHDLCVRVLDGDLDAIVDLANRWQAIDDDERRGALLEICAAQSADPVVHRRLGTALDAAAAVSAADLRARGFEGAALGEALVDARGQAVRSALKDAGLIS